MRSVLNRHNLEPPSDLEASEIWLAQVAAQLSDVERLLVRDDLESLVPLGTSIARVETQMAAISQTEQWCVPAARVMQLLGLSVVHAMAVLGAIGDIGESASALTRRKNWLAIGAPHWPIAIAEFFVHLTN